MIRPRDRASAAGLLPRMEARPRKDGLVTYRYHPVNGKPINLGTDKGAALREVLDMNGRSTDEGTVGQLWRLYKESPRWKRLAGDTQTSYEQCWKALQPVWENGIVAAIKPSDVARYITVHRADAPIRANREMAVLSNLFKLAVTRGEIDRNPCREVSRNPEEPRTRLVEKAELQPFIEWALKRGDSAVVLVSMAEFAALTGNRRAEFRTLHWPQVDDEIIRLQRAKGRGGKAKRELVAVSDALQAVMDRMKARPTYSAMGPVFPAPRHGRPYTDRGFKAMWNRLVLAAMKEKVIAERFTFHDLRAHYTTYFKLKFGELPEMHADPATTAKVYERSREVRRKAL